MELGPPQTDNKRFTPFRNFSQLSGEGESYDYWPLPARGEFCSASSANWATRMSAAVIDMAIVAITTALVVAAIALTGVLGTDFFSQGFTTEVTLFCYAISALCVVFYPMLWVARHEGQSIGKRVFGLRIARADGALHTTGHAFQREVFVKHLLFGLAASLTFGTVWLADVLWPLIDEHKRTLHDLVAGTRVIDVATQLAPAAALHEVSPDDFVRVRG